MYYYPPRRTHSNALLPFPCALVLPRYRSRKTFCCSPPNAARLFSASCRPKRPKERAVCDAGTFAVQRFHAGRQKTDDRTFGQGSRGRCACGGICVVGVAITGVRQDGGALEIKESGRRRAECFVLYFDTIFPSNLRAKTLSFFIRFSMYCSQLFTKSTVFYSCTWRPS